MVTVERERERSSPMLPSRVTAVAVRPEQLLFYRVLPLQWVREFSFYFFIFIIVTNNALPTKKGISAATISSEISLVSETKLQSSITNKTSNYKSYFVKRVQAAMSTGRNLGSASFRKFFEKLKDDGFWDTRTRTITYPFLSSYTRSKWDGSGTGKYPNCHPYKMPLLTNISKIPIKFLLKLLV